MANIYQTTVTSKDLAAGTHEYGFGGEIPASELWESEEIANILGVTEGTAQFSDEPYLKWFVDGKVILKSKKPIRYGVSWNHLNEVELIYGNKGITDKKGNHYIVRLMRASTKDPAPNSSGETLHNSEWNRLMLPIHENAKTKNWKTPGNVESDLISEWDINYTDDDLVTVSSAGRGYTHICQESYSTNGQSVLCRGYGSTEKGDSNTKTSKSDYMGWSPVLELLPAGEFYIKGENSNTLYTKNGQKAFTKENIKPENGYAIYELDRKVLSIPHVLVNESFYKKAKIDLKVYFDIHSIGVK